MDQLRSTSGAYARRRRADAPQTRLRAGAVPGDRRLPELRHLVHDHLDPGGLPDVVLHRVQQRRPDRHLLGLAARRPDEHDRLARDGGDRLCVPHRRRPGLLVVEAGGAAWGWFTGWFNLVGQIAVTAAIGYGLAIFLTTLLNFWFDYPNTKEWTLLVYGIVMLIAVVINLFKVWITALLNTVSAYWHMVGVAFIVLVLIIVPDHHQSFGYVFGHTINNSGFGGHNFGVFMFWYVFGQGLLMSQYTITGFDASAHMAEETAKASRMAAVGMYMSVVASVFFGWILLLAVTFAITGGDQGVLDSVGNAV